MKIFGYLLLNFLELIVQRKREKVELEEIYMLIKL